MKTIDYHGSQETFRAGQQVIHIDDDGALHSAVILAVTTERLELIFEDGDEGTELPNTCFIITLPK